MFSTDSSDLEGSLIMSGQNFALDDSLIWTDYDGLTTYLLITTTDRVMNLIYSGL